MTNKKAVAKTARKIRKKIKKVDLPLSIKLAKKIDSEMDFLQILWQNGFVTEGVVTDICPDDDGDIGFHSIKKDDQIVGRIDFDCCGLLI